MEGAEASAPAPAPTPVRLLAAPMLDSDAPPPRVPHVSCTARMVDMTGSGHLDTLVVEPNGPNGAHVTVAFVPVDTSGDGRTDALIADVNGDGRGDALVLDTTGNGIPNFVRGGVLIDTDGDGRANVVMVDTTGDGQADTLVHIWGYDLTFVSKAAAVASAVAGQNVATMDTAKTEAARAAAAAASGASALPVAPGSNTSIMGGAVVSAAAAHPLGADAYGQDVAGPSADPHAGDKRKASAVMAAPVGGENPTNAAAWAHVVPGMDGDSAAAIAAAQATLAAAQSSVVAAAHAEGLVKTKPPRRGKSKAEGLIKQGWTRHEDETIINMVQTQGQKWSAIAAALEGRTDDAVRNRYLRLKKKKIEHGDGYAGEMSLEDLESTDTVKKGDMWTRAEDERIMSAVADHGLKWQEIAQQLPGRSAAAVQNRYLRLQKSQNIGQHPYHHPQPPPPLAQQQQLHRQQQQQQQQQQQIHYAAASAYVGAPYHGMAPVQMMPAGSVDAVTYAEAAPPPMHPQQLHPQAMHGGPMQAAMHGGPMHVQAAMVDAQIAAQQQMHAAAHAQHQAQLHHAQQMNLQHHAAAQQHGVPPPMPQPVHYG